ncbi:hypothetical protein LOTGIDRAFT_157186 [Lottia gigantea]|uniref:Uncharacterized protein n=1 Tax=Lottia gigantea TaxID=225164 RepID=V4CIN9_LOTGI|nr:hypothetical protein LOTGIDRAFT_157186 [Lottia gigantea]ESP02045.1 hypothetical protein LOTGIDRAFT_157186 [Lottia gigantea]
MAANAEQRGEVCVCESFISIEDILFGKNSGNFELVNILLVVKELIYKNHMNKSKPCFPRCIVEVKRTKRKTKILDDVDVHIKKLIAHEYEVDEDDEVDDEDEESDDYESQNK